MNDIRFGFGIVISWYHPTMYHLSEIAFTLQVLLNLEHQITLH